MKQHILSVSDRGWIKKYDVEYGKCLQSVEPLNSAMSLDAVDYNTFGD